MTLLKNLDHIGIAVRSIEKSLQIYVKVLGLKARRIEEVVDQKTRTALLSVGAVNLELLEATSPDSPVARFLTKRGEGIHHLCFRVDDLEAALAQLKAGGVRLIDQTPRCGAGGCMIAFIHPASMGGILIELSQTQTTTNTKTK